MSALLSEQEVLDIAKDMNVGSTRTLHLSKQDEVVVIVKEKRSKVEALKGDNKVGVSPFYAEDINVLQISISPSMGINDENSFISANISLDEEVFYNSLKKAAESQKGLEFYSVSEDLEVVSARRVLRDELGPSILLRQLKRHEK